MATHVQVNTPAVAKTTAMGPLPSPLTAFNAAQDTTNVGDTSPARSTGTEQFADYVESESGEEQNLDETPAWTPAKKMKTFTHDVHHGLTPPGLNPLDRDRVQAVLRTSKGWEATHPDIPGKTEADAVVVEDYVE